MLAEPGTVWRYSSAEAQLLSAALTRASGQSTRRYVESHVLDPIGAQVHSWAQDASGVEIGGYGVEMTARDLARFGLLYLRQGRWLGAEVVPAEWIAASTTVHAVTPWTRGDFGYLWWVRRDEGYRAGGRYGQQLNVFPDRDLLVIYLAQLPLETADDILDSVTRYYVLGQGNAPVSGDYGYQSECTNTAATQVTGGTALPQVTSKWAFGDGESTFCPEVDATGRLCFEGVAAAAGSDYSWWGAVLQLQLAEVRDDQIIPFDAAARGIAGVRLRVDSVGALPAGLRLGLSRVDADGIDYQQNPFVRGGGSAGDFHEEGILEASFTEFSRPFWSELPQSATLDPGALFGLNVQVVTTPTSSFGYRVCVSELTWLDGSRSPID